jgi:hypothetical protein
MAAILFDDILTGLSQAIQKAQAAIDAQHYETFKALLSAEENTEDDQGNRTQAIKSRTVLLPMLKPDGTTVVRKIPLVTLLKHDSLHLDEVRIKMAFRASWNEKTNGMSLDVVIPAEGESAEGPSQEIQLVFKRGDPPEGIARVNNELTKII